jgi:6,7-dimethyl-8-ribityllumazine synthase
MNQMLQDPDVRPSPEDRPPPPTQHRRFAKPQRVAFVQSSWHRDVVEECRIAFLQEIEARGIAPAHIDLFEVPGSWSTAASTATSSSPTP